MRSRVVWRVALVVSAVTALSVASPAVASTPWSGSGTGTTTVVDNGATGTTAQFTYSVNPGNSGSWRFATSALSDGPVDLSYAYTGYHAFFQVRVSLTAFVTSGGVTTTFPLVNAGPVNCCTPPSGGFSYAGTIRLSVHAGDTYGFDMTGSNGDSDRRLLGTLTVVDTTPGPSRAGYCAAAGNTNPTTGAAIPAGAFINLLPDQPTVDPHYKGATPAIYVDGTGITCDPPPAGYAVSGYAGDAQHVAGNLYPYYKSP